MEIIGEDLDPTRLIINWLAQSPEEIEDVRTKVVVRDWVETTKDADGDEGVDVSPHEINDLQEYFDKRVKKDGDLKRLRDDLTKYATQYAPREIGDIRGFVDWALTQVDWEAVHAYIGEVGSGGVDSRQ